MQKTKDSSTPSQRQETSKSFLFSMRKCHDNDQVQLHKLDSSCLYKRASLSIKSTRRVAMFSVGLEKGKTLTTHLEQMWSNTELLKSILYRIVLSADRTDSHLACMQNHTTSITSFPVTGKRSIEYEKRSQNTLGKKVKHQEKKKGNICRHLLYSWYLANLLKQLILSFGSRMHTVSACLLLEQLIIPWEEAEDLQGLPHHPLLLCSHFWPYKTACLTVFRVSSLPSSREIWWLCCRECFLFQALYHLSCLFLLKAVFL